MTFSVVAVDKKAPGMHGSGGDGRDRASGDALHVPGIAACGIVRAVRDLLRRGRLACAGRLSRGRFPARTRARARASPRSPAELRGRIPD
jgi:hypothetical protein